MTSPTAIAVPKPFWHHKLHNSTTSPKRKQTPIIIHPVHTVTTAGVVPLII